MSPVTYFVRMRARAGQADRVLELLLTNPLVEPDSLVFGKTVPLTVLGYELPSSYPQNGG